jgi:hypothetical protein
MYEFLISHACYMARQSHPNWFDHPKNVSWSVQFMKLLRWTLEQLRHEQTDRPRLCYLLVIFPAQCLLNSRDVNLIHYCHLANTLSAWPTCPFKLSTNDFN